MRRIKLTTGKWATVDDRFYDEITARGRWFYGGGGYARRNGCRGGRKQTVRMHRVVLELAGIQVPHGFEIDHKNGRKCDNRLNNLRLATRSQNRMNTSKSAYNTSGVKGVSWHKQRQRWTANIKVNGRQNYLGLFETKHKAADAYRKAARNYFGEFARSSFDVGGAA